MAYQNTSAETNKMPTTPNNIKTLQPHPPNPQKTNPIKHHPLLITLKNIEKNIKTNNDNPQKQLKPG